VFIVCLPFYGVKWFIPTDDVYLENPDF